MSHSVFSSLTPLQHTGISEVTYPHIRYISSRIAGFGRTYEVRLRYNRTLHLLSLLRGVRSQPLVKGCVHSRR